jgi:hypothetical protein
MPNRRRHSEGRADNVATSLRDAKRGETVLVRLGEALRDITLAEDISYGHKFAVRDNPGGRFHSEIRGDHRPRDGGHPLRATRAYPTTLESLRGPEISHKEASSWNSYWDTCVRTDRAAYGTT